MMNALFDTARDTIETVYKADNLFIAIYRELTPEQKNQIKTGLSKIIGVKECHVNMTSCEVTNFTIMYTNGTASKLETMRQTIKDWLAGYLEINSKVQPSLF